MGNFKKLKRIIAYSAVPVVVLGSAILFTYAFSEDGGLGILSGGVRTKQQTEINDKQAENQETDGMLTNEDLDKNGAHEEQDVRKLVEDFGKELQKVSLLAPEDLLIQSIKENYGSFITPDLLQKWLDDPQSTPGRMVSSPWPDHIDILDMEMNDKNQYTVNGEIVEVTSTELENGGAAARRPVTIIVRKIDGRWLISSLMLGDYLQPDPVAYENT